MKVLLLVDIQNDFCPGGALAVPDGDQVVGVANRLMETGKYDLVVASKDYHPANHISYASNHPDGELFSMIEINGGQQTLWPDHCQQGTPGAEFHPELKSELIDLVVPKGVNPEIDSYSAFYDNQRQQETGLRAYLEEKAQEAGIPLQEVELHVCGLATDYCVKFTAMDAAELGLSVSLAVDGCRAVNLNPGDDLAALQEMAAAGVDVTESRELLGARERQVNIDPGTSQERTQDRGIQL